MGIPFDGVNVKFDGRVEGHNDDHLVACRIAVDCVIGEDAVRSVTYEVEADHVAGLIIGRYLHATASCGSSGRESAPGPEGRGGVGGGVGRRRTKKLLLTPAALTGVRSNAVNTPDEYFSWEWNLPPASPVHLNSESCEES